MRVLVSDANILIDIEKGQLTEPMFRLPFEFATPDMLFHDELAECHGHLVERGLQCRPLDGETLQQVVALTACYGRVSRYDCMALALAIREACPLLTGDAALRKAAAAEKIAVHGTLWLVEAMVAEGIVSVPKALKAYDRMERAGSRLPWDRARARLRDMKH